MERSSTDWQTLDRTLSAVGLRRMGGFTITPKDNLPLDHGTLALIGPEEPKFWSIFEQSDAYRDAKPNPLDRWTKAVIDLIAATFEAHALYPFGGPPYQPFYTWALRTGQSWASPIGFLVHADAGLFASYRAALVLPGAMKTPTVAQPCDTCTGQPCKTACPVDAFSDGYDVASCKTYLRVPNGQSCMTQGCAARRACPVGRGKRLPEQAAFHMKAFL